MPARQSQVGDTLDVKGPLMKMKLEVGQGGAGKEGTTGCPASDCWRSIVAAYQGLLAHPAGATGLFVAAAAAALQTAGCRI